MDLASILPDIFEKVWWLVPVALIFALFRTSWFKGWLGEQMVRLSAGLMLPRKIYHPVHNVTLPTPDGTTQVDHIFVSRYGVFVVETKNMKGWIFGRERDRQWTQKIYRHTRKFQNPLRQNFKHVEALKKVLGIPPETVHSVIVFVGGSTFKTNMPANVTHAGGYVRYIKSFKQPVLSERQVEETLAQIKSGRLEPSSATHKAHVRSLKARSNPNAIRRCPKCGSIMLLRTAKRGARTGEKFWGCSSYPECKVVQSVA